MPSCKDKKRRSLNEFEEPPRSLGIIRRYRKYPLCRARHNGYYVLFRMGGIEEGPACHQIKRLGIYFSRHGYLWLFDVSTVIKEKELSGFIRWFKKRARQDYDP